MIITVCVSQGALALLPSLSVLVHAVDIKRGKTLQTKLEICQILGYVLHINVRGRNRFHLTEADTTKPQDIYDC
jgi:hypothetical protein